jgi:hypothetical protein
MPAACLISGIKTPKEARNQEIPIEKIISGSNTSGRKIIVQLTNPFIKNSPAMRTMKLMPIWNSVEPMLMKGSISNGKTTLFT